MMLLDGITCHESTKRKLEVYAANHGKPVVKPFMLVVCKDTDHAAWVESFIKSDEFRNGAYRNKTIIVHSKQKGSETEANTRLLLDVENPDNPVEIVIHVNMLKEGWDVNNLYTIVPLRTAASKILREQMVGRGLRLPYGERTGDRDVDAVMLTAHDKFNDILEEAQKRELEQATQRIRKLDEIIQRLYEDNLEGKISDERFAKMTTNYEAEQHSLEQRVAELRASISAEKETALNADHFLALVRKYTEIPELTAEIIREFVEKVYVYKAEKVDGHRVQRIKIIYNCIGEFTLPDAATNEKTA